MAFSDEADANGFFRLLANYGLLMGFPLVLYITIHGAAQFLLRRLVIAEKASILSTGLCLAVGICLLVVLHTGRQITVDRDEVEAYLASQRWQDQVAALKAAGRYRTASGTLDAYAGLADSPHIPVRYWLARALTVAKGRERLTILVDLLDDPAPNVVCQALYALAKSGNRIHTGPIMDKIRTSDHWYIHWYAYTALKALGWKQKRSV